MDWKFWKKAKAEDQENQKPKTPKKSKPTDLDSAVGRNLVVEKGLDPDWVWQLKQVKRLQEGKKSLYDVRGFMESAAVMKKVVVKDYSSLDDHPDLVVFEGWYDKTANKMDIKLNESFAPKAA